MTNEATDPSFAMQANSGTPAGSFYRRSGIGCCDDLQSPEWHASFSELDVVQQEIVDARIHSPEYIWPYRPLQDQTRPWEYPYVYCNIRELLGRTHANGARVVDLGSGFTFFPFCIARLGHTVLAIDSDPVPGRLFEKAKGLVQEQPGSVSFQLGDIVDVPVPTESVDLVYCISVLEHIPDQESVVRGVRRILRKGGIFVLTVDIDLAGNFELGPDRLARLVTDLQDGFIPVYQELPIHPLRMLTNRNQPFVVRPPHGRLMNLLRDLYSANKQVLRKEIKGSAWNGYNVSTYGTCLKRVF